MEPLEKSEQPENLTEAMEKCKNYAQKGHQLALEAVSLLEQVSREAVKKLEEVILQINASNYYDNGMNKSLSEQLSTIRSKFKILPQTIFDDINTLSKTTFTITLFGRTMAGKSTLMEILTHGDGKSIGKGAQRTTRDVRTYSYRGLQITDVPGIAAFEGKEDEEVAFMAAKKCDLILFLITDDAPQANEAECLGKILALGKPVICIINIKANIDQGTNLKLFKYDLHKKFNENRIETLKNQFIEFGNQYGQNWHDIEFVCAHLKSVYLSQSGYYNKGINAELYDLSNFRYVEQLIVNEICQKGSFYKFKSYLDTVTVPMLSEFEVLFNQCACNSEQGTIILNKKRKLKDWTKNFENDSKEKINLLINKLSNSLKNEITSFAEDNYDNPNASNSWNKILQSYNIEESALNLLNQLKHEYEEELKEITREINADIKFASKVFADNSINMDKIIDYKAMWNKGAILLNAGILVISFFIPVGLITFTTIGLFSWLGSFLFQDKKEKVRDARFKLEQKLIVQVDKLLKKLKKDMFNSLYKNILKQSLYPMICIFDNTINSLFTLADTQYFLGIKLNRELRKINYFLISEALVYYGYEKTRRRISNIAKIPGFAIMIAESYPVFPIEVYEDLSSLLKENVLHIVNNVYPKTLLMRTIWKYPEKEIVNPHNISIENVKNIFLKVHIPFLDNVNAETCNRIRLAKQITEFLIIK